MVHKKEIIFSALPLIYANVSTHQENNIENEGVKKCIWSQMNNLREATIRNYQSSIIIPYGIPHSLPVKTLSTQVQNYAKIVKDEIG